MTMEQARSVVPSVSPVIAIDRLSSTVPKLVFGILKRWASKTRHPYQSS